MKADAIIRAWKEQAKRYLDGVCRVSRDEDSWDKFVKRARLTDDEKWVFESILNAIAHPPADASESIKAELYKRRVGELSIIRQYPGIRYQELLDHAERVERQLRMRVPPIPSVAPAASPVGTRVDDGTNIPAEDRVTLPPPDGHGFAELVEEMKRIERRTDPVPRNLQQSLIERCRLDGESPDDDPVFTDQEADTYRPNGDKQ